MAKIKIVTAASSHFVPYVRTWVASVRKYMPQVEPLVRLVNCTADLDCEVVVDKKVFKTGKQQRFY